jgi:hypothetical protein
VSPAPPTTADRLLEYVRILAPLVEAERQNLDAKRELSPSLLDVDVLADRPTRRERLYAFPLIPFVEAAVGAVPVGIAHAALDTFAELAKSRRAHGRGGRSARPGHPAAHARAAGPASCRAWAWARRACSSQASPPISIAPREAPRGRP